MPRLSGIACVDAIDQFNWSPRRQADSAGRLAAVSVVTKSGTRTPPLPMRDYQRDDALNAKNALTGTTLPMRQAQFGGSSAGRSRNRTFFGNAEGGTCANPAWSRSASTAAVINARWRRPAIRVAA
jgi:hypothetical protein